MESKNALSKRKSTRLRGFDYGKTGAYFLTVCTENRKNILSTIAVGEGSPLPILSPCGEIVDRWIKRIPEKYPNAYVDRYVIMPNHIHILLSIVNDNEQEDSHNDTFGRGDPLTIRLGGETPPLLPMQKIINNISATNQKQNEKVGAV